MWRERLADAEKIGREVHRNSISTLRILVDHWPAPWAQRRFMGERAGVWILGVLWLSVPVALAVFMGY